MVAGRVVRDDLMYYYETRSAGRWWPQCSPRMPQHTDTHLGTPEERGKRLRFKPIAVPDHQQPDLDTLATRYSPGPMQEPRNTHLCTVHLLTHTPNQRPAHREQVTCHSASPAGAIPTFDGEHGFGLCYATASISRIRSTIPLTAP